MLLITGKADPEMMTTEKYGQSLLQICALALNNVRKSVHRLGLDSNGTKASHVQELCAYVSNDGKVVCIQTHYNCIFTTRKYGMVMNSVRILSSESLHFHFILLRSYIEVIRGALHSKTGSNRSNQLRLWLVERRDRSWFWRPVVHLQRSQGLSQKKTSVSVYPVWAITFGCLDQLGTVRTYTFRNLGQGVMSICHSQGQGHTSVTKHTFLGGPP